MYMSFFGHVHANPVLVAFELVILVIFFLDLGAEIYHKLFNKRTSEPRFKIKFYVKAISLILLFIDSILALARPDLDYRPFLIFRCGKIYKIFSYPSCNRCSGKETFLRITENI